MALKRAPISQESSSYHPNIFSTQEKETSFNWYYAGRSISISHYLDGQLFKECNFVEAFTKFDLRNFVFKVPQKRFSSLVRFFFSNLTYSNGVLSSEVKKHPIQLSLEEFTEVCNLPCINQVHDESDEGNQFNYDFGANSFLIY